AVASRIDRRVDLENPDWVILIEVFGKTTGVSIVNPKSILNIPKELAESSMGSKESPSLDDERG
ncbi:MAG: THUMP domain-containing protein, partial [Candidatus Bathyarchaeia archaeon]